MPELARKCIDSWRKVLPEYELKEWNEDNFDMDAYPYVREAYDNRKFAFVTDVVRLYAIYNYGGVYMDTDVEVLKPLDPFLDNAAFSGYENDFQIPTGLMAGEKGCLWALDNLNHYVGRHFIRPDGSFDMTTNVDTITNLMIPRGLRQDNSFQAFPGYFTIYPKDYFCPKSYKDGIVYLTENTVTIHHFAGSWHSKEDKLKGRLYKLLGHNLYHRIATIVKKCLK